MFITLTPCSSATLLRFRSLVITLAFIFLASITILESTSLMWGKSSSTMRTSMSTIFWILLSTSSPRRPRPRLSGSGIGDVLELVQDELRQDERPLQKTRFAEIGYPAVDDDAGIENLVAHRSRAPCFERPWLTENACRGNNFDAVDEAEIGKDRQKQEAEDRDSFKVRDCG